MKRSKFTDDEGTVAPVGPRKPRGTGHRDPAGAGCRCETAGVCRRHRIGSATFYAWKTRFGGMEPSKAKRLKVLEGENAKLKRLPAEAMPDIEPLSAIGPRAMARGPEGPALEERS